MTADSRFSVLAIGRSFLECPRWHRGQLWLSDFYTHEVIRIDLDGRVETIAEVPQQPGGLGFLPDGRLLVVSMRDRRILRQETDGRLVTHADLSAIATGHLNDMVVDPTGRAYVGNFGFDLMGGGKPAAATLARVDPDGSVHEAAHGLQFPNGSTISADGRTLVVAETLGNRMSAFDIGDGGVLGPRRDWAVFAPPPSMVDFTTTLGEIKVAPDGTALDAEGAIWAADAVGRRVLRVAAGGQVLEEISTAPMGCYACGLGGSDGRTLFLCVAPDFQEDARKAAREAELWSTQVAVPAAA